MALLKHIPSGDLYPITSQLMARVGKDMELVGDDGLPVKEESPVAEALNVKPEAPKRKGKAIHIEGEE